jgi:hypothetical protein
VLVRHLAAGVTALVLASGIGLLAGTFGADQFWLRAAVFSACTLGPAYGLGWLLFLAGRSGPDAVASPEDTVERDWWHRSASGSFLDLIVVAGLGLSALAVADLRVDAQNVLAALVVFGLADVTLRHALLSRRDA